MPSAQGLYAESISDVTASSTTFVDVCSITAASFTANKNYLILANAFITSVDSSAREVQSRIVHGTTPTVFTDAALASELTTGDVQAAAPSWMTVFTQPGTTELVKLQVANSLTNTTKCQMGQLFALNLDDIGTQNTDWFYTEDTVDYTTTASKVSKASITFTPNGTDDWLIIGSFAEIPGSVTANYLADINDSVAGVLTSLDIEGEDVTNEVRGHVLMRVVTPSNASHTFSIRFSHETTAGTVTSNRIFALNLNKFKDHAATFLATAEQPAASPSWTTTRTLSPTPTATGNWFIWGYIGFDVGTLTDSLGIRLQINPSGGGLASNPNYGDDLPKTDDSWDATDVIPINIFTMLSMSSGASRTINLDTQAIAGTTLRAVDRQLVAFSLNLASGGTQYNQSAAGTLTTAGALVKQDNKVTVGTATTAGSLTKQDNTRLAGTITSSGSLTKQDATSLAGTLTSSGVLTSFKMVLMSVAGTLTSSGTLVKQTATSLAGTLTTAGALVRQASVHLAGTLTSSGVLNAVKTALMSIGGTLTSSATLTKQTATSLAGTVITAGAIVNQAAKIVAGSLSSSGVLAAVHTARLSITGTLTSSGVLVKQTATSLAGAVTSSGALTKQMSAVLSGVLSSSAVLAKQVHISLSGLLSSAGALITQLIAALGIVGTPRAVMSAVRPVATCVAVTRPIASVTMTQPAAHVLLYRPQAAMTLLGRPIAIMSVV